MEQGSEEWLLSRVGRVGCSRLGDVLAEGKGGAPSASRRNYMAELLCERLTGKYAEHFTSAEMQRGIDLEPIARATYEARFGVMVKEDGGRGHPAIIGFGCSPDGLIGDDGGLEIKCPNTATHLDTLLDGKINLHYIYQMAGGCLVYDRAWWDFVSFDDRLPDNLSFYCKRFYRDNLPLAKVESGVIQFLSELDALERRVRGL